MARAARLLVEHTRYYGLIIEPDCIQEIHDLIEARVKGTRPFAAFGPYSAGNQEAAEQAPIQLAAGVTLNDGTWIDATMALAAARSEPELERAGPGPKTSRSFQQQVLDLLELLDTDVAGWWRRDAGEVRSRSAKGWFAWRFNDYAAVEHGQPIIVVDETYSAAMVVEAIVRRLTQFGPFRDRFEHDWLARHHLPTAFTAVRDAHVKEMAGIAGAIAEMYISAIGSLTPSGEVIVTLGDLSRNGFRWDQLLVVLPFMAHFRKGIKLLKIKLSNGQVLGVSGDTLERLQKLPAGRRKQLIAKAQKARTEKESLAIIKRGATAPQQAPTKGKQPKQGPKARPKRGPGRWVKEHEGMPERARAYQAQVTGRTGQVYLVGGVKFDGFKDGVLIETKGPGYVKFVEPPDAFQYWFSKRDNTLDQAARQVRVSGGVPIEWHVADKELKPVLERMFQESHIVGIKVVHTAAQ